MSKYGHALTWFASNHLIAHDKKTQAMILGNPFQEPVIHIGDSVFFLERNNLSFEIDVSGNAFRRFATTLLFVDRKSVV